MAGNVQIKIKWNQIILKNEYYITKIYITISLWTLNMPKIKENRQGQGVPKLHLIEGTRVNKLMAYMGGKKRVFYQKQD